MCIAPALINADWPLIITDRSLLNISGGRLSFRGLPSRKWHKEAICRSAEHCSWGPEIHVQQYEVELVHNRPAGFFCFVFAAAAQNSPYFLELLFSRSRFQLLRFVFAQNTTCDSCKSLFIPPTLGLFHTFYKLPGWCVGKTGNANLACCHLNDTLLPCQPEAACCRHCRVYSLSLFSSQAARKVT